MNRVSPILLAAVLLGLCACTTTVPLSVPEEGETISPESRVVLPVGRSLLVRGDLDLEPGDYLRAPVGEEGGRGVIRIQGRRGITLDLDELVLRGRSRNAPLDESRGRGIVLANCEDIVLRGGELGGYRACIWVENCRGVELDGIRFQGFHAERLRGDSFSAHPDDELDRTAGAGATWAADYGAAICVIDSSQVVVHGCTARAGQNGVLFVRSEDCQVYDSDFSFLSGWGVALDDSSQCVISNNRFDYCVRGVVADGTRDGRGSAGMLCVGRSGGNVFAHNSATHCGIGALTTAGGEAQEAGSAAAQPNLWYRNDLSYGVECGALLEARASESFVANEVRGESYSGIRIVDGSEVALYANRVEQTLGPALNIEGGSSCYLVGNELRDSDVGVRLDGGSTEDSGAHGHWVVDNQFEGNLQDVVLERALEVVFDGNRYQTPTQRVHLDGLSSEDAEEGLRPRQIWAWLTRPGLPLPSGRACASTLRRPGGDRPAAVRALLAFEPPDVPGAEDAALPGKGLADHDIAIGTHLPWDLASGAPRPQSAGRAGLLAGLGWDVSWFRWGSDSDPRGDLERWRALRFSPVARGTVPSLTSPWGNSRVRAVLGEGRYGLYASGQLTIRQDGRYVLSARSDDGVRVLIDDEVVLEDWTWHPARALRVEVELERGEHAVQVEYFQIDGPAVLSLRLDPCDQD